MPGVAGFVAVNRRSSQNQAGSVQSGFIHLNPTDHTRVNAAVSPIQNRSTKMAAVVSGGAFLGFVLSLELWLNNRAGMKSGRAVDFIDLTIPPFGRAMMWALMVPLISLLRTRGPLGAGRVGGGVGYAFAMSFVVMATYSLGRMLAYGLFFGERFKEFRPAALSSFCGRNIIDLAYDWAVLAFGYSLEIDHRWKNE